MPRRPEFPENGDPGLKGREDVVRPWIALIHPREDPVQARIRIAMRFCGTEGEALPEIHPGLSRRPQIFGF